MVNTMRNKKIVFDTAMLLFSNIVVKGLGFVYRVLLVRYLGTEGIGLVEMVSPLFSFLIVLSGLGIQTSMTQLIARKQEQRFLYLRTARIFLLCTGLTIGLASFISAPLLIQIGAADQRVFLSFLCVIPAIPIISYASAYRGYLQGLRRMQPIAASQNTEQLVRSLLGVLLAAELVGHGLELAAIGPSLATVCGEGAGLLMLLFCMGRQREDIPPKKLPVPLRQYWQAGKELLSYGLPLTGGRLVASGIMMLQAMLIPLCLKRAGWNTEAATTLYGQFSGVAMSLLHLPGVFTAALSVVIMPAVAESVSSAAKSCSILGHRINTSLRATLSGTVPGMLLLYLFAEPYCILIFDNAPAAPLLRILALGGVFFYLQVSLTSILQGLGEVRRLLLNSLISGVVLLLGICFLVANPRLGICGAAIATSVCWLSGFLLNYLHLRRYCGFSPGLMKMSLPPVFAAFGSGGLYQLVRPWLCAILPLTRLSATITQSVIVALLYGILLFFFGGISVRK